jgi:4-carboxymuconolactone decarboxylase
MSDDERWERGAEMFSAVVGMRAPNRGDDYVADVVIDQVFAEIWTRPGLTRKERRWIAITCACMADAPFAMETHLGAALRTGDITIEELREFVIHFAVYAGHPKATAARAALDKAYAQLQPPPNSHEPA